MTRPSSASLVHLPDKLPRLLGLTLRPSHRVDALPSPTCLIPECGIQNARCQQPGPTRNTRRHLAADRRFQPRVWILDTPDETPWLGSLGILLGEHRRLAEPPAPSHHDLMTNVTSLPRCAQEAGRRDDPTALN